MDKETIRHIVIEKYMYKKGQFIIDPEKLGYLHKYLS